MKITKEQSEQIQENIIACIDANLENLVGIDEGLSNTQLDKLKTDLCQILVDAANE